MGNSFFFVKTQDIACYLSVLVIALVMGVMSFLVMKHQKITGERRLAASLLIGYFVLVMTAIMLLRRHLVTYDDLLKPFWSYVSLFYGRGNQYSVVTENVLNVLMLIPIGFLLPFLIKNFTIIIVCGFLCSLYFIEAIQPGTKIEYFEIYVLFFNLIGVLIGYSLYLILAKGSIMEMPGQKQGKENDDREKELLSRLVEKRVGIGIVAAAVIWVILYHFCAEIGWNEKEYRDKLSIVRDAVAVLAFIISAVSLFLYTQREKRSYLRLMANSYKKDFWIDLENVGPGLAEIIDIEVYNKNGNKSDSPVLATYLDGEEQAAQSAAEIENKEYIPIVYTEKLSSNLIDDVIVGGGKKHHLFRCSVNDFESLEKLWKKISECKIIIRYRNVFGIRYEGVCTSHFDRDYQTFKAAVGDRKGFEQDTKVNRK